MYGSTGTTAVDVAPEKDDEPRGLLEMTAPYLAEFVGTFLLVFTMGCNHIQGDPMWNPTGVAFALVVAVYSFGSVSGAHLNPAVTLTLGFVLKFPWNKVLGYILAQCSGAILGSLSYMTILNETVKLRPPQDAATFQWYDISIIEALYTFMMCFVFINCVASDRNNRADDQNHFFALAVGFVYIAGGYSALNISGGMFNPAASLAYAVTSSDFEWWPVYALSQIGGAWLASLAFAIVRPEDFKLQYDGELEDYEVPVRSKLFSEFVGTFLVVVTAGLSLVMISPAGPWSTGACYMCLIYSLGDISGAHLNPAVTFAVMLSRRGICGLALGQSYILHQLGAGLAAGFVCAHFNAAGHEKEITLGPKAGYGWGEAGMGEAIFTALVAFAYLSIATTTMAPSTTKTNFYFGLAIGSTITIGGFAVGALSGGALNPAVALGRGVSSVLSFADIHKIAKDWTRILASVWYSLFEFSGSAIAAIVFFLTHQREYIKDGSGFPHIP